MARARRIVFRIFYSTSFTIVFLLLLAVICVVPADAVYQSYKRRRLLDIFIIAGAYFITAFFAILIYASRIYTNRSVLKDIPKTFMPIEKEDLPNKRISAVIDEFQTRSAVIAYLAKPRRKRIELESESAREKISAVIKAPLKEDDAYNPTWGQVANLGWSSPAAAELAGLEYRTIVCELPDLIEAKAVSLAPIDPMATPGPDGTAMPDRRVLELLQRSHTAGMRQYLSKLIDLGVVLDDSLNVAFLAIYEQARFSASPLSNYNFHSIMRMFAEVLRNMRPIDVALLGLPEDDAELNSHSQSSRSSTFSKTASVRHHNVPKTSPPIFETVVRKPTSRSRISFDSIRSTTSSNLIYDHHSQPASHYSSTVSLPLPASPSVHGRNPGSSNHRRPSSPSAQFPSNPPIPQSLHQSSPDPSLREDSLPGSASTSLRSYSTIQSASLYSLAGHRSQSRSPRSLRSRGSANGSVIRLSRPEDDHSLPYTLIVSPAE